MRSPFPGMDPYLEAQWPDVHVKLIAFIADALGPLLPPGLRARSEEDVAVEWEPGDEVRSVRPDVAVTPTSGAGISAGAGRATGVLVPRPVVVHIEREATPERRVVISDRGSGRIVTAIEVLSPANKSAGARNRKYLKKLGVYRELGANIVEIDLLRHPSRARLEVDRTHLPPAAAAAAYMVGVCRASEADDWEMYAFGLREAIPPIPVPLRAGDADVVLELQALVDRIYENGRYADDINYAVPPEPPLSSDDAAWAAGLVAGRPTSR